MSFMLLTESRFFISSVTTDSCLIEKDVINKPSKDTLPEEYYCFHGKASEA